ncbi:MULTISPECIES: DoxX family protein [Actinomycetes]|uniref:DoxX family protein n=2 Tax=Actinomycetes TaxID=1760 RepID=A0ABP6M3L7_9MICC
MGEDIGLLILRLVLGLLIAGHGAQKVSRLFGGEGLDGGSREFAADGFIGGRATAVAAGASQLAAGLLLALGLMTPAAAMIVAGVMTLAVTVKHRHGLWSHHGGYEYPLVLIVGAAALALAGPGSLSLDALLGLSRPPLLIALGTVGGGVGAGLAMRWLLHASTSPLARHRKDR